VSDSLAEHPLIPGYPMLFSALLASRVRSPIRVRIVVDPMYLATDAFVINVLAGCLWLLLAWTRKVDNRYTSNIFGLIALSRCVNASYWGSLSMSRLLSSRVLNSSSVNTFCAHKFVRAL
jgi:hypothetical protein